MRGLGYLYLAMLLVPALAQPCAAETRVALVIGNGAYKNAPRLINPLNDATDVAAALKRDGFETILATDLTKDGMDDATIRFARAARNADVAMFYYSGHALQFGGVNYLAPVDAKLTDEADLRRMVRLDDVVGDLQQAKSLRILVLDSCRDNPLADELKRSIGATRAISLQRGLAKIDSPQGMIVAYATQSGRTAADGDGRNSPYTTAFLKNIEAQEEIGTIFRRVSNDVYDATRHEQLPELSLSLIGEFYLRGKAEASAAAAPATPQDPTRDDFQAAERVDTVGAWDAFLKQHPDGFYASLAQERRAKVQAKVESKADAKAETKVAALPDPGASQPAASPAQGGAGTIGVVVSRVSKPLQEGGATIPGAGIVTLWADGAAEKAGLLIGDIIVKFDGKEIADARDLPPLVRDTPVGKQVDVVLSRGKPDNPPLTIKLTVGSKGERAHGRLGVTFKPLSDVPAWEPGGAALSKAFDYSFRRPQVASVSPNGAAQLADIRIGDVILKADGKDVETDSLPDIVQRKFPGDELELLVRRDDTQLTKKVVLGRVDEDAVQAALDAQAAAALAAAAQGQAGEQVYGLRVADLTPELRASYNIKDSANGVVITAVDIQSQSDSKPKVGDLVVTGSVAALKAKLDRAKSDGKATELLLLTRSNGGDLYFFALSLVNAASTSAPAAAATEPDPPRKKRAKAR
jgi:uncharacterized caspase-like protein